MSQFSESVVEDYALAWSESLRSTIKHAPEVAGEDSQGLARCEL